MSDIFHIVSLDFPIDIVKACPGISIDIGGSVVKLVYRSKEDWEKAQADKDASVCPLRLLTCARDHLDAALAKVKDEAFITKEDGKTTKIYSCGVGGYQWNDKIKSALDVEVENVQEGDCLIAGLDHLLKKVPLKDCMHPIKPGIERAEIDAMKPTVKMWDEMNKKSANNFLGEVSFDLRYPEEVDVSVEKTMAEVLGDDMYPYCVLQLGSAYAGLVIEEEGVPKVAFMTPNGGRHLMGVASLLLGIKSYNEFIDLVEQGNVTKVSQTISSLAIADNDNDDPDDPYAAMKDIKTEHAIFSFGHAVFKERDDFKREDIAQAWLLSHIDDIVMKVHAVAVERGVKNFVVCGSLAIRESVRNYMVQKLAYRDIEAMLTYHKQYFPRLYFPKNGGHTGSVGAMLNSVQKFTKDRHQTDEQTKVKEEA